MRRLWKVIHVLAIGICIAAALGWGWLAATRVSATDLPPLRNGDLVFQTIRSTQTAAIMAASASPYTHVGIIKLIDGAPFVVEAVGPVREIDLDGWIAQGVGGRITIKRLRGLSQDDASKVLAAAGRYFGRPYDFFFLFDKERIYCSELVRYAFLDGIGREIGEVERLSELNMDNAAVRALIEKRWRAYPPCAGITEFDACNRKIRAQELVTPESVAAEPDLETVFSNYGI